MLNCNQTTQLVSQSLDRRLTLSERFALQLHLMLCKFCKRFSQQIQIMRVNMKTLINTIENDDTIKLPSSAKNRITELAELNRQQP
jgi:hypothetical protein